MENVDAIFPFILPGYDSYRASHLKESSSLSDAKPKFKGNFILDTRIGYHFTLENRDFFSHSKLKNITNREYTLRQH